MIYCASTNYHTRVIFDSEGMSSKSWLLLFLILLITNLRAARKWVEFKLINEEREKKEKLMDNRERRVERKVFLKNVALILKSISSSNIPVYLGEHL